MWLFLCQLYVCPAGALKQIFWIDARGNEFFYKLLHFIIYAFPQALYVAAIAVYGLYRTSKCFCYGFDHNGVYAWLFLAIAKAVLTIISFVIFCFGILILLYNVVI